MSISIKIRSYRTKIYLEPDSDDDVIVESVLSLLGFSYGYDTYTEFLPVKVYSIHADNSRMVVDALMQVVNIDSVDREVSFEYYTTPDGRKIRYKLGE